MRANTDDADGSRMGSGDEREAVDVRALTGVWLRMDPADSARRGIGWFSIWVEQLDIRRPVRIDIYDGESSRPERGDGRGDHGSERWKGVAGYSGGQGGG